ncbi:hypothetical protein V0U79_11855 [Hyphobacterium sp. HN65]|uniref:Tetratricopeptide repeat protein n=1 Tax=Hyphobacterium lacteum TaxID=3116575 RepID=A0ABU7LU22_9PROT|nr:hypothetical protein [Hyphobacterium sp. HN65]MEE2527064.1 hypothetical protein [Hyphobacterium sp. HN65]
MIIFAVLAAVIGFAMAAFAAWPAAGQSRRWLAPVLTAGVVLVAATAYLASGQPGFAGAPYARQANARMETDPSMLTAAQREERWRDLIREDETNAEAWTQLGRMLARSERELEAINAFQRSLRLELDARTLSYLGETFINLNQGQVTAEAVSAFEEANRLDPDLPEPAFFLGLADFQRDDVESAETRWLDLIARLDARSPYRILIAQQVYQMLSQPRVDAAAVAAAADDPDFDPRTRIVGMIARLQERTDSGEAGFADRLRLVRAYGMMGQDEDAGRVLLEARETFSDNEGAMVILDILLAALAIDEDESE